MVVSLAITLGRLRVPAHSFIRRRKKFCICGYTDQVAFPAKYDSASSKQAGARTRSKAGVFGAMEAAIKFVSRTCHPALTFAKHLVRISALGDITHSQQ